MTRPHKPHPRLALKVRHIGGRLAAWRDRLSDQALLAVATAILCAEMTLCAVLHLSPLPVALCGAAFLVCILHGTTFPPGRRERLGRLLTVALLLKTFAVGVGATGGLASPYMGLLYLPVFLGALYFGFWGSALPGIGVCALLTVFTVWDGRPGRGETAHLIIQALVFVLVSVVAGGFAQSLRHAARAATRRARHQAARARRIEWFTDTAVMMQALSDPEPMLSAALLRLSEIIPSDSAAVFLRDTDRPALSLAQTTGLSPATVSVRQISLDALAPMRDPFFKALLASNTHAHDPYTGEFAALDPDARSVLIVPLQTFEDFFGVLYLGSHTPGRYTERDQNLLWEFARHIGYPLQRVRLQAMATTDGLTGLFNRRAFRNRLRDEAERASRYGHPLTLVMIDIDHFKRVNDTYGHPAGDAVLTQMGSLLRRLSRGIDFAARYGGEELALLCPETGSRDALGLAERIRQSVEGHAFALPDGSTLSVTVSLGVATQIIGGAPDETALVDAADRALYAAKAGGRNRVGAGEVASGPVAVG